MTLKAMLAAWAAAALPLAVLAQASEWPDLATPVDEEQLLRLESAGADFAGDDTSLLQARVEFPAQKKEEQPSLKKQKKQKAAQPPLPYGEWPPHEADIPQAPWAWALWQEVGAGPPRPESLSNATTLEPPGDTVVNQSQRLQEWIDKGGKSYRAPRHLVREETPAWVWICMGNDYDINNFSSWDSTPVATPQLVPFVVPEGTPGRSDVSVIIAPGGGGTVLAWESEGTDVAKWLNKLGISAFVLKYRVPDKTIWKRETQVYDAQRAVSLVKHMAPALSLNASRVGLFGSSHGGWVALFSTFAAGRQYPRRDVVDDAGWRPDFLLLLYPEVHLESLKERAESSEPVANVENVQLTNMVDPPPMFIATGANDNCCPPNTTYGLHNMLRRRNGNPLVEINVYEGMGHGFSMCYREGLGGWAGFKHSACLWLLTARKFIKMNVEGELLDDLRTWYEQAVKFDDDSSLVAVSNATTGS